MPDFTSSCRLWAGSPRGMPDRTPTKCCLLPKVMWWEGSAANIQTYHYSVAIAFTQGSPGLCRHEPNGTHKTLVFFKRLAHRQDSFARRRVARDVGNEFEESP